MDINAPAEATIEAMVFRAKPKPRFFPRILWKMIRSIEMRMSTGEKRITGEWEDKGVVSWTKLV